MRRLSGQAMDAPMTGFDVLVCSWNLLAACATTCEGRRVWRGSAEADSYGLATGFPEGPSLGLGLGSAPRRVGVASARAIVASPRRRKGRNLSPSVARGQVCGGNCWPAPASSTSSKKVRRGILFLDLESSTVLSSPRSLLCLPSFFLDGDIDFASRPACP